MDILISPELTNSIYVKNEYSEIPIWKVITTERYPSRYWPIFLSDRFGFVFEENVIVVSDLFFGENK
jgi:hypothetical protein